MENRSVETVARGFEQIETLFNNKGEVTGVGSGFKDLDDLTSGFQKGDIKPIYTFEYETSSLFLLYHGLPVIHMHYCV